MLKKLEPKKFSIETTPVFPHCDSRILHAPGECSVCDVYPKWQELRYYWGIAFTGYTPEGTELPCPADYARGDSHAQWHGNRASKRLGTNDSE